MRYLFFLILLTGCGYRFSDNSFKNSYISVPYVLGDDDGILTNEIIYEMTKANIKYDEKYFDLTLKAEIIEDSDTQIGYRYDRKPDGSLEKNIMATESRKNIKVRIELIDDSSDVIFKKVVKENIDYDYVTQDSLQDLSFILPDGSRETVLAFSLGQLESVPSAQKAAKNALYKKLAKKIVEVLLVEFY